jgi:2-isopropylmalate synthase
VANSLAAVQNGARQIEGTINGIGERAGNVALEEVIMALKTRADVFGQLHTDVHTKEILKTSRIVSRMSGLHVQRSKAIVGENAFAHSSGIHQDGMLKMRETYEIMDPVEVGWGGTELPLTKHSGRHAMAVRIAHLGFKLSDAEIGAVFTRFKEIGDKKKFVYDDDLSALVDDSMMPQAEGWQLEKLEVTVVSGKKPHANVVLVREGEAKEAEADGNGAVDAAMRAVDAVVGRSGNLLEYNVQAVTQGHDALGEVTLKVDFGDGRLITGKGASTDVIEASARAYLNAINRTFIRRELGEQAAGV